MERKLTSSNYLNQSFLEEKCVLNELINLLSKRWMTEVIFGIEEGHNRFSSLKEELESISDHILAGRLRMLEANHFITKQIFNDTPMRVEYTLTEQGRRLSSLLGGLCDFAETITLAKEE